MGTLPTSIDLSPNFPRPGNQGAQGSCTAWAVAYLRSAQEQMERNWGVADEEHLFSPSFIYNQIKSSADCRKAGSTIPDALNLVRRDGIATLSDFPYDQNSCDAIPSAQVKQAARGFPIADWRRVNVQDEVEIKTQLSAGFPVVAGIIVDDAFGDLRPDQIYTSPNNVRPGAHAIVVVGYDDSVSAFRILNSWGSAWSDGGFGWIDYQTFRRIAREGYVAQDVIYTPPRPRRNMLEGIRVIYFSKPSDRGVVDSVLANLNIKYEKPQGTGDVPTALLTCTPDVPGDELRTLALALYDGGIRLKRVNFALRQLRVSNRITLESTDFSPQIHALSRADLMSLDRCKFLKNPEDPI
ncbi:C1 family peptidase [Rhizobium leguminosarum]|uniref:C1 family peptidase n=1 Tax=Rhizobium leguminosarum TaxID=384 RepID=UPI001FE17326|nr:C1 family peptidase [Rhizobium leguminosarum]